MIPNSSFNVSSVQVSKLPLPIAQIEGYFKGATADRWLQIFDSCTTPAAAAVPIYQIPIQQTAQFFENLQVAHLPITEGIFIGISTTEGTWTASTDAMDINVWTENNVKTATVVGDKTTALNTLQVWTEAAGAAADKALYSLIITELLGSACKVLVYADDATVGKIQAPISLAANQTITISFAPYSGGLKPLTAGATPATPRIGCTVVVADAVPAAGVAPTVSANRANILAITN